MAPPVSVPGDRSAAVAHVTPPLGGAITTDWAGEVASGATFSGVGGSWTVPAVVPSVAPRSSSTWIGLGGVSDSNLIEAGTSQSTADGSASYDAWVDLPVLSAPTVLPAAPVGPGDVMTATIVQSGNDQWTIQVEDVTRSWSFQQSWAFVAPASSAEWVEGAPTVGGATATLADFGAVRFTGMTDDHQGMAITSEDVMSTIDDSAVIAYPTGYDAAAGSFVARYGTPPPFVYGVSPAQGATVGGTEVTLTGDFFYDTTEVLVGTSPAGFTYSGDGDLLVTTPPGTPGTVDIQVVTNGGSSPVYPGDQFTYQEPSTGTGYDLVGSDGGVFVFGGAYYGSLPALGVHVDDIMGIVPTAARTGYFLVGADGGVFAFDAPFANSLPGVGVHVDDIVGIMPTADDRGYLLVGRDGGVFSFDAPFENSLPGIGVHVDDIVGIATTSDDDGYWLVGSDGSVYAFGDASWLGNAPAGATAIAPTPSGHGYWVVDGHGDVSAFGDAGRFGGLTGSGVDDIVGIDVSGDAGGYELFGRDGGVFGFGDAPYFGSLPALRVHVDDIVGAVRT